MEHDKESEVVHVLTGATFKFSLPERAGRPIAMCNFRNKLLVVTDYGYIYQWDEDKQVVECLSHYLSR